MLRRIRAAIRAAVERVEAKVKASTTASALLGVVLAFVTWAQDHPESLPALPRWLQGLILLVAPPAIAGVPGWLAPHTPRADLNAGVEPAHPPVEPAP